MSDGGPLRALPAGLACDGGDPPITVARAGRSLRAALIASGCALVPIIFAAAGCGPSLTDRLESEARARDRLERKAVVVHALDASVAAGQPVDIALDVVIAEGFYLPAPGVEGPGLAGFEVDPPRLSWLAVEAIALPPPPVSVRMPYLKDPIPMLTGTAHVGLRLRPAAATAPERRQVTIRLGWQQCTIRGCSVPQRRGVPVWLDVQPPAPGDPAELAP